MRRRAVAVGHKRTRSLKPWPESLPLRMLEGRWQKGTQSKEENALAVAAVHLQLQLWQLQHMLSFAPSTQTQIGC